MAKKRRKRKSNKGSNALKKIVREAKKYINIVQYPGKMQ